jgi:NAD(P)-dependent dehydrogenase (short-subunit alcohol dehydrogenase family)
VLITGGSSGIGLASAMKMAEAGAITIIVARGEDKLLEAKKEILDYAGKGAIVHTRSADLGDEVATKELAAWVSSEFGGADFLINNAGRSIRRGIESSYDRFHDFERCMQINYFGALRLTLALLPQMTAKRKGHIVNISSIGVLTNAPRFSAYVASKAALDAWTRCASSEYSDTGVSFTTINMPLVRTPMIAPTKLYNNVPVLSPEEAANLISNACIYKPARIATRLGIFGQVLHAFAPKIGQIVMNTSYRMFPDSDAAKNKDPSAPKAQLNADQVAFQALMRGVHF